MSGAELAGPGDRAGEIRVTALQLVGVASISGAMLLLQLALSRILSVATWYHFAFLTVSIALFGLAAGGVTVHLSQRLRAGPVGVWFSPLALLFSVSIVTEALVLLWTPVAYLAFRDSTLWLIALLLTTALPFYLGGLCLALAITRGHSDANRIYAADLLGAAFGVALFVPAMKVLGGGGILLLAAVLGGIASAAHQSPARVRWSAFAAVALLAALVPTTAGRLDIRYPKSEDPVPPPLYSSWDAQSRVTVSEAAGDVRAGQGSACGNATVDALDVSIDSSALTPILLVSSVDEVGHLECSITSAAYLIAPRRPHALVIGPGGGRDVWAALRMGARQVTGVDINAAIVNDLVRTEYRAESGDLYRRNEVTIRVADGRSFVRQSPERFDVIQAPLVDTWAATAAGAFTLTENTLYTVEALGDYLDHLTVGGVIAITRWQGPETLRLINVAIEAGRLQSIERMTDHLIVIGDSDRGTGEQGLLANILISKRPITSEQVDRISTFAASNGFSILYSPGPGETPVGQLLSAGNGIIDSDHHDLTPVYDDRPFFFQTAPLRWDAQRLIRPGAGDGLYVLLRLLVLTGLLVLLVVLGPLWLKNRRAASPRKAPGAVLAYFGLLGVGFMLVEVAAVQRFVLYLGHPTYAFAVVLSGLLLGGACGSWLGRRAERPATVATAASSIAAVGIALSALAQDRVFVDSLGAGLALRIVIALAMLLPLGVAMGVPLPSGVRAIGSHDESLVAWAWAMNGAASVLGATGAILLAMIVGFANTMLAGSAVYAVAAAIIGWNGGLPRAGSAEPAVASGDRSAF